MPNTATDDHHDEFLLCEETVGEVKYKHLINMMKRSMNTRVMQDCF